ncbi:hypothetical protein K474DRAFT_654162 [Panus rudis PR-1116 ss-1]|nr:hypothetical protein K474DRAFT_654162 [Panus rudis PR-1116 ss-1]
MSLLLGGSLLLALCSLYLASPFSLCPSRFYLLVPRFSFPFSHFSFLVPHFSFLVPHFSFIASHSPFLIYSITHRVYLYLSVFAWPTAPPSSQELRDGKRGNTRAIAMYSSVFVPYSDTGSTRGTYLQTLRACLGLPLRLVYCLIA